MNQDFPDDHVIVTQKGALGVVTLNRPKALNALSLDMIRQIDAALSRWENDDSIARVLFCGAGGRAFCAGGDVKSFYHAGMQYRRGDVSLPVASLFFKEEYRLNHRIFHYSKPTFVVMDGITMGGGYGIAGHCKTRIATENTRFAMPEVGIGFFPDVGASYHLNNAPGGWGRYLALTGDAIGPGDMIAAGLADGFMLSADCDAFYADLADGGSYENHRSDAPKIEILGDMLACFEDEDVADIVAALKASHSDVYQSMMTRSPLSILVTDRHIRELRDADFDTVIAADFERVQHFIQYPDFYEGVRAALLDKDRMPVWNPAHMEDVKDEDIARYFTPVPGQLFV